MRIIIKAVYIAICAALSAAAYFTAGSYAAVFSAAAVSAVLFAYNSLAELDTIPDSDYLYTGEGLSAAAGIYTAASFSGSSIPASFLCASGFALFHIFILKHVISPAKREVFPAGFILAALLWAAALSSGRSLETAAVSLTGIPAAPQLTWPFVLSAGAAGLLFSGMAILIKPELALIKNGCAPMIVSRKRVLLAETISLLVRSLTAAGLVLSGGIFLSFGFSARRSGLASGAAESLMLFFGIALIVILLKTLPVQIEAAAAIAAFMSLFLHFIMIFKSGRPSL